VILVDTSVWVSHLRSSNNLLVRLLDTGQVLIHQFVIGEIALGNLRNRHVVLSLLDKLPRAATASEREVLHFIDRHNLSGAGIGLVDAHLLAAVQLTAGAALWTSDRRLREAAARLALAAHLP
jgi:predicted nucleic acid-binding protein